MSNFASFVDRLVGATSKAPSSARYWDAPAAWLACADAVFAALTEFLLSTLIFLTIAGMLVVLGG